ncbi:MAG: hypothetical protein JXL84_09650 [Deltaproteobacteria bacterium]|nr:hypothetical protein [Deltaproteobacteria bacterium]
MAVKECFGILDQVFPKGEKGLREVPGPCRECPERVLCLRSALSTREGLGMKEEMLQRAERAGLMSRLERWSRKKQLSRLMSLKGKENR